MTKMCTNRSGVSLDTEASQLKKVRERRVPSGRRREHVRHRTQQSPPKGFYVPAEAGIPLKGASKAYLTGSEMHPLIPSKEEESPLSGTQNQVH